MLRNDRTPAEIDERLAEVQKYVEGKPALQSQLREALKLGIYLIEEAQAGRLKIPYGSPHCLRRCGRCSRQWGQASLRESGAMMAGKPPPASGVRRAKRTAAQSCRIPRGLSGIGLFKVIVRITAAPGGTA